MSDNKEKNKKEIDSEKLTQINGGTSARVGGSRCPKCGQRSYDSWNKKCENCGYKG